MTDPPPPVDVIVWLDQHLGPPWSGLVLLAVFLGMSAFSAYVAVKTIHWAYRDSDD